MSRCGKSCGLVGSLLVIGGSVMGCGGGTDAVDQGPRDMGADASRTDAPIITVPACEREDLFISAIDLDAGMVTLFNPTSADINMEDGYQFCQFPNYSALPIGVVPAGGSVTIALPASLELNPDNGTLNLYSSTAYGTRAAMLDFLCWGDGDGLSRLNVAQTVGSDSTVLWDGGSCVSVVRGSTIFLRNGAAGNTANDYQTAPVVFDCSPPVVDAGVDAGPVALLECERDHLIIESVDLDANEIVLYNPTAEAIETTGDYQLCQGPGAYEAVPITTIPAFGRLTVRPLPTSPIALEGNQALALYRTDAFGLRDAMVDYVCWGTPSAQPRLGVAQATGIDGTVLWDNGGCLAAGAEATIYRIPATEGNSAADYSTTAPAAAIDCD